MTEAEKCSCGLWYDAGYKGREEAHIICADLCYEYNSTRPSDMARREQIIRRLFGRTGKHFYIEPAIFCGFGYNIEIGDYFFANNNCVFVDPAKITFGEHVLLAPGCCFYTALHPLDAINRKLGLEKALPITVGDNVWFGGNCVVLPGVTVGSNTVIGAGSVVTKSIPSDALAYGNPCKVRRFLDQSEQKRGDNSLHQDCENN